MYHLVAFIMLLSAFPFLFPDAFLRWSQGIRVRLQMDQEERDAVVKEIERLLRSTQEWKAWMEDLDRHPPRTAAADELYLLVSQSLIATRRYRQDLDPTRYPRYCLTIDSFCQRLENLLLLLDAKKKEGGEAFRPRPQPI